MHQLRDSLTLNTARFNRLRKKPLSEIAIFLIKRSRQTLLHAKDRIKMLFGEIKLRDKDLFDKIRLEESSLHKVRTAVDEGDFEKAKVDMIDYLRFRTSPLFFFNRGDKDKLIRILEKEFPQAKKRTLESAEDVMQHSFELLGKKISFYEDIDWHFVDNRRWPLSFSPNIDYFSRNRLGDIKISWELNRTQHFVVLGKAYWYTGDEKYAKEFSDQLLSWIRNNPYKKGINWMEGIEAAIRLFSWVWAFNLFLDSEHFNCRVQFELLKSIYMHSKFLESHLSDKWRINNNHLIVEAAGLVLVGITFPEFKEAQVWSKKGIKILEKELNSQILPDGGTWEQSSGYHKFVTETVLHVIALMMKNQLDIPEKILQRFSAMVEFLIYIAKPNGKIPLYGDEDQGRVMKLSEADYDDTIPIITNASILLDRKDWLGKQSEETLWLFGTNVATQKQTCQGLSSRVFKDSGIMVMRDKDKYILFVAGAQNPRYLHASHRHIDGLSFVLDSFGSTFLVDPGAFTYFGDFRWRKYFKSREAHNTIVIDEREPVDINEIFESSGGSESRILGYLYSHEFDWIAADYTEYRNVNHIRHLFFVKPEYWILVDFIDGSGEHIYDMYFHFCNEIKTEFDSGGKVVTATSLDSRLRIVPLDTPDLTGEILRGEVSPRYGEKFRADVLRYRKRGCAPQLFVSLLCPLRGEEVPIKDAKISRVEIYGEDNDGVRALDTNTAVGIRIDFEEYQDYLFCSRKGEQNLHLADFGIEGARIVFVRKVKEKTVRKIVCKAEKEGVYENLVWQGVTNL